MKGWLGPRTAWPCARCSPRFIGKIGLLSYAFSRFSRSLDHEVPLKTKCHYSSICMRKAGSNVKFGEKIKSFLITCGVVYPQYSQHTSTHCLFSAFTFQRWPPKLCSACNARINSLIWIRYNPLNYRMVSETGWKPSFSRCRDTKWTKTACFGPL